MIDRAADNEYATGHGVLNDFSSELYKNTMRMCRPIISGEHIIKHTHAGATIHSIDKILNLSYSEQDLLLDYLTELVIERKEKDENWEEFMKLLIDKIMSKPKFKGYFDALEKYFISLNGTQKIQIIGLSITKLNSAIDGIRWEINNRLWIKNSNVKELMVVDQILYFFQNVINSIPLKVHFSQKEKETINKRMGFSNYLILRLEAYRRGKISLDDLDNDLSLSRGFKPQEKYIRPSEYEFAFEIFGG